MRNYKLTSSYFSSNISKIERKNSSENDNTVASLRQPDTTNHNKVLLEQYDLKLYDTLEECVRAVEKKEASCTYVYTYCAQEFDKEDFANRLKIYLVPNLNMDFALGISNNCDSSLMTILDKASQLITDNETQEIIDKYTSATVAQNILSFFYDYPFLIIGIFLFIAILACLIIIYYMRYKIARKSDRKNSQLARFMEYVCTAYDYVIDVNLVNRTGQKYYLEDEKVITKEMSFNDESIVYDLADLTFHPKYEKAFYEILTTEVVNSMIDGNKGDIYFEGLAKRDNEDYEWYSYTIQAIKKDASYPRNLAILIKNINTLRKEEMAQNQALSDAFELARSANEAKSSFMSRMSHEIRSPLNAIIGYITIAKTTTNDSHRLLDYIDKSEMAAKHLLSIINDILDISSIESGKMKIAYDDFNVKQLITSISSLFYAQAIQKDLEFTAVVKEISEEWVIGDQLRVSQILMNLLSNAIKFTPSNGQVSLIVTQKVLDNDRIHMIFEIKDTGIGMSDEFLQRIYSPFEQESASTSLKYGGTGLGLSITHNLVEMMNGTMDIESKLNEGTTFKVTLPLGHSALHENNPLIKHDFSDIRALVVDDCEDDREYIKEILTKFKIETDVCKDGPSAIKQLKRRFNTEYEYKLCLIDWKMEGMNGVETAEEIRKKISKEVPIIIVTSYDISEVRQDAKNIGVNMIVSKPLFPSTIFNMLINSYDYHIEIPKEIDYSSLENKRILLVEDNFMNREIAMKLLEQASIKVEIAVDGKEAVEKFAESSKEYYDAILMDIQMPNMNGYDATKAIRKLEHENAKDIPIIAMTADVFADDVAKAIAAGMNDHIAKPIDYQKMLNTIKKQFNKEEGTNKDE